MSIDTSAAFIGAVASGRGIRLAVKDVIDMRGRVTTAGCKAVERAAGPAERDATCLAGAREAEKAGELHFVGKTNLDELAGGATGINPWYGTPVNPLDPHRIPGGSSSGSAVAVAAGHADIAIGTDTGGSVRIPAACTGIAALKTTHGRVPVQGTHPLSQTLDSIGPLATDVSGLVRGMQLLEPGFYPSTPAISGPLGRVYFRGVLPEWERALDDALLAAGLETSEVVIPGWDEAQAAAYAILVTELWRNNAGLYATDPEHISDNRRAELEFGRDLPAYERKAAYAFQQPWCTTLQSLLDQHQVLCMTTLGSPPPLIAETDQSGVGAFSLTMPINLARLPAVSLPVHVADQWPASLQLVGPARSEELLLGLAALIEDSIR